MDCGSTSGVRPDPDQERGRSLANGLDITRTYDPDREAMLAALRLVLGLPRVPAARERER